MARLNVTQNEWDHFLAWYHQQRHQPVHLSLESDPSIPELVRLFLEPQNGAPQWIITFEIDDVPHGN